MALRAWLRDTTAVAFAFSAVLRGALGSAQTSPATEEIFFYRHAGQQTALDVQLFEPSTSPRAIFMVEAAQVPAHLTFTAGLWGSYANLPLVLRVPSGPTAPIVEHDARAEIHASLGLFQALELGVAVPVAYTRHARAVVGGAGGLLIDGVTAPNGAGALVGSLRAGDARLSVKVPLLRAPVELAGRLQLSVPTGGLFADGPCERLEAGQPATACALDGGRPVTAGQGFSSSVAWSVLPQLLLSRQAGPVLLAANVGYRLRSRNGLSARGLPLVVDDELQWGIAARWSASPRVAVSAEVNGRVGVLNAMGFDDGNQPAVNSASFPVELLGGVEVRASSAIALDFGLRRGLSAGYGAPFLGGFAGLRWSVVGRACAHGPEDYDGFEDQDYCEDPDNDRDGVLDGEDRCPNDPEDLDGVLDVDGCADPDNDADGRTDDVDRCPVEPEDHDGTADADGCPDPDNDRDGVNDVADQCPNDPEDLDHFEDADGCPEPGPQPVVVTRTESRLLLSQRIYFEHDSDVIRNVSFDILNEVAVTLRRNPDIGLLRIEGHTDSQGAAQYNLDLSFRRARAVVEYLVQRGVERSRLDFRGYGSQRPASANATADDLALNRRVEFLIAQQGGAASPSPTTEETPPLRPRRRRR
jgi:outer membrane protein OmpA-like peptidoglycan-associated protein